MAREDEEPDDDGVESERYRMKAITNCFAQLVFFLPAVLQNIRKNHKKPFAFHFCYFVLISNSYWMVFH